MKNRWLDDLTVSQESSLSLLARAQGGDSVALEALMGRYLTRLQRWASGRLPAAARSALDTDDLVQDALFNTFRRLDSFRPQHDGALLAYLRQAVVNRIRNELRRPMSPAAAVEPGELVAQLPSPLDTVVGQEELALYERALAQLDEHERAAIIARFELGYSYDALARELNRPSPSAARKLTERALRRLIGLMQTNGG